MFQSSHNLPGSAVRFHWWPHQPGNNFISQSLQFCLKYGVSVLYILEHMHTLDVTWVAWTYTTCAILPTAVRGEYPLLVKDRMCQCVEEIRETLHWFLEEDIHLTGTQLAVA